MVIYFSHSSKALKQITEKFEKNLKKLLTRKNSYDILIWLSQRAVAKKTKNIDN